MTPLKIITFLLCFVHSMKIEGMAVQMEMESNDNKVLKKATSNDNDVAGLDIFDGCIVVLMRMLKGVGGGGSAGSRPNGQKPSSPTFPAAKPPAALPTAEPPAAFPSPTPPTLLGGTPSENNPTINNPTINNPTINNPTIKPTGGICNKNLICSGFENCRNCRSDCRSYSRLCGDGRCVEGENCMNCPSDCAGNVNQPDITADEKYCCGFDDGIKPDGCGDDRCKSNGYACVETTCEGLNSRRNSAPSEMSLSFGCFSFLVTGTLICLFAC